jgi:hypothetical protein
MKLDEMITLLRSVNCEEGVVTSMIHAYEMGFDHGSRAYTRLTDVVECATKVCEELDGADDMFKTAWRPTSTKPFWAAMEKLKEME